ncbi:MAG: DUF4124 domain-containing protein [Candidatus Competibacteraceae bacterium]|nr:DUF4124 domain-containing protein [Candidatus Competibacteraceae bacterium]
MNGLPNGLSEIPDQPSTGLRHCRRIRNRRHRLQWRSSLLLSLLLIYSPGSAQAEDGVYTWKDASGRVHYSNRPPEGQPAVTVPLNAKPVRVQPTERIYTWTDSQGKVHYGPKPPSDAPAKELKEDDSSLSTIRSGKLRAGEEALLRDLQRQE